jgi:hypothetical protein
MVRFVDQHVARHGKHLLLVTRSSFVRRHDVRLRFGIAKRRVLRRIMQDVVAAIRTMSVSA